MKMVFLTALFMMGSTAFARDSEWLLCKGETTMDDDREKLVVSIFEHRSGASSRATDLTLIFGGFTLTGSFDSTNSSKGKVKLKQGKYSYNGEVAIDYLEKNILLKGYLNIGSSYSIKATLDCETLRN